MLFTLGYFLSPKKVIIHDKLELKLLRGSWPVNYKYGIYGNLHVTYTSHIPGS
jgi:hypothetical protein